MSLQTTACEICQSSSSRYRCPRCAVISCSLACVRRHKEETDCDGIRDKTAFVSIKDFTDLNLLSDYRYLEETERQVDSACRDEVKSQHHAPYHVNKLMKAARGQDIRLQILPYPMSRRTSNRSYYHNKFKEIEWQVEWIFPKVEAKFTNRVMGNTKLLEAVTRVINPALVEPLAARPVLSSYLHSINEIRLFMKMEKQRADMPRYYRLSLDATLTENLAGKVIIEYPTLYVALGDDEAKSYGAIIVPEPSVKEDDHCIVTTVKTLSSIDGDMPIAESDATLRINENPLPSLLDSDILKRNADYPMAAELHSDVEYTPKSSSQIVGDKVKQENALQNENLTYSTNLDTCT